MRVGDPNGEFLQSPISRLFGTTALSAECSPGALKIFAAFSFIYMLLYFAPFIAAHFAPGPKTIFACVIGAAFMGTWLVVLRQDKLPFFAAAGSKLALDMTISFAFGLLSRASLSAGRVQQLGWMLLQS